ncbi:MAG TPA: hypothetical protein VKR58_01540 [Aquella sp.]|nr:hypothetical protein [Aquella sp.]
MNMYDRARFNNDLNGKPFKILSYSINDSDIPSFNQLPKKMEIEFEDDNGLSSLEMDQIEVITLFRNSQYSGPDIPHQVELKILYIEKISYKNFTFCFTK